MVHFIWSSKNRLVALRTRVLEIIWIAKTWRRLRRRLTIKQGHIIIFLWWIECRIVLEFFNDEFRVKYQIEMETEWGVSQSVYVFVCYFFGSVIISIQAEANRKCKQIKIPREEKQRNEIKQNKKLRQNKIHCLEIQIKWKFFVFVCMNFWFVELYRYLWCVFVCVCMFGFGVF